MSAAARATFVTVVAAAASGLMDSPAMGGPVKDRTTSPQISVFNAKRRFSLLCLLVNLSRKYSHRLTQRHVFWLIPDPIKVTAKINHHLSGTTMAPRKGFMVSQILEATGKPEGRGGGRW